MQSIPVPILWLLAAIFINAAITVVFEGLYCNAMGVVVVAGIFSTLIGAAAANEAPTVSLGIALVLGMIALIRLLDYLRTLMIELKKKH